MPAPNHEHASLVASLLQSGGYRNKDKCRPEILQALHHYSGLKPKLDKFTFNDGRCKDLICLFGTIPVPYRNATYNIPVTFWILDTHPSHAPLCYVTPTPDMSIKVSSHVDGNGKIYLPYLHEWDPNNSDILGLIQMCIITFGEQPPVFARPAGSVQQHPPPPPRPVYPPQAASNYPGYPPASSGPGYPPPNAGPVYPPSTGPGYPPAGPVYPPNSGPAYPPVSSNNSGYPTPYPPAMSSQSSVESTGTITQEHILMSMRQGVEDKIRQKLSEEFTLKQAIIQSLRETQDGLNKGQNQLRHAVESVDRDYDAMERSIQELKREEDTMKEALKEAEKLSESSEINPEDAVSATTPLYRQLVNAHAEESAVSEAIYYLGEALKQEIIDCDVFLKQVRKMARKQFLLRATMEKARQVAGLPV
jgi:ESCRT-I complex subunit TSG101